MSYRSKSRRTAAALAAGVLGGVGLTAAVAAPAAAIPTSCQVMEHPVLPNDGAASYCAGGTGYHRIALLCSPGQLGGTENVWVYGPWAAPGDHSIAACFDFTDSVGGYMHHAAVDVVDPA